MKTYFALFTTLLIYGFALADTPPTDWLETYLADHPRPTNAYQLTQALQMMVGDPEFGEPKEAIPYRVTVMTSTAIDSSRFALLYVDVDQLEVVIGKFTSDTAVIFSAPDTLVVGSPSTLSVGSQGGDKIIYTYRAGEIYNIAALSVSDTVITEVGSALALPTLAGNARPKVAGMEGGCVIVYSDTNSSGISGYGTLKSFAISGTTITETETFVFHRGAVDEPDITSLDDSRFVIAYTDGGNEEYLTAMPGVWDPATATVLELGNEVVLDEQLSSRLLINSIDTARFLVTYEPGPGFFADNPLSAVIGTLDADKPQIATVGTPVIAVPDLISTYEIGIIDSAHFLASYIDASEDGQIYSRIIEFDGVDVINTSNAVLTNGGSAPSSATAFIAGAVDSGFYVAYTDNTLNQTSLRVGTVGDAVLPVGLATFEGEQVEESVELSWQTVIEQNNEGFEVQRRGNDGEWTTLDFVEGHGTMMEPIRYTYTDAEPLPGINYYRLRQVDNDGASDYSETIAVAYVSEAIDDTLLVYPNPVTDGTLYLDLPDADGAQKTVHIYTTTGQLVLHSTQTDNALSVSDLSPGMYVLQVSVGTTTHSAWLRVE